MKTENVYLGRIYKVGSCRRNNLGEEINLYYHKSAVMVCKKIVGIKYMKDLETGERYRMKLSSKKGVLYVSRSYLENFNVATGNKVEDLPKDKILALGKAYLKK